MEAPPSTNGVLVEDRRRKKVTYFCRWKRLVEEWNIILLIRSYYFFVIFFKLLNQ